MSLSLPALMASQAGLLAIAFFLAWSGAVWLAAGAGRAALADRSSGGAKGAEAATPPGYWLGALALILAVPATFALLTAFPGLKPGWMPGLAPLPGEWQSQWQAAPAAQVPLMTEAPAAAGAPGDPSAAAMPDAGEASGAASAGSPGDRAMVPVLMAPVLRVLAQLDMVPVLIALWALGAAWLLARLALGIRRAGAIVAAARPLNTTGSVGAGVPAGTRLLVTESTDTAFAWALPGSAARAIVLPRSFVEGLSAPALKAIIAHEAAHLARRDPQTGLALAAIAALVWVSPFVRLLIGEWRLSAELACDAAALNGASPAMRKAYAQTLIDALRIPAGRHRFGALPCPAAAFSATKLKDEKMRLTTILKGRASFAAGPSKRLALASGAAAIAIVGSAGAASMAPEAPTRQETARPATAPEAVSAGVSAEMPSGEELEAVLRPAQPEPAPEPAPALAQEPQPPAAEEAPEAEIATINNVDDEGTFRQVITYADGTRVERDWDDLTPEEKERIKADILRAEKDLVRAQKDIERAEKDIARSMADIEDMEFGLDAAERERIVADLEAAIADISREQMMSEEERAEIMEEIREQIEEVKMQEAFTEAERARMQEEVRREMERARAEIERSRDEIRQELARMRERNEELQEQE